MDEWLEWLQDAVENFNQMTPIERLEFQEEIDRLTENGQLIVIHGHKSQGKSQWVQWVIDRWPIKGEQGDE